jgi:hypothetical protein
LKRWAQPQGETLFIDARKLGTMQTRTLRVLTGGDGGESMLADGMGDPKPDADLGRIVYAFRQWRGEPAPAWWDEEQHGAWAYRDIPGFCKAETITGIGKHGFVLTPGRYVGAEEQVGDGEPFVEKYPRLLAELEVCFGEGERLMAVAGRSVSKMGHRLNRFIEATDRSVLQDAGRVTAEIARAHAESEFEKYRIVHCKSFHNGQLRVLPTVRFRRCGSASCVCRGVPMTSLTP